MGLAFMLEMPLLIINVQRGGPSTGLPTKTEQSDLMQAMYARNGESPIPIIASKSPSDCFMSAFKAVKLALEHNSPVILLSDGYIANGSEPWRIPNIEDLPEIQIPLAKENENYLPYKRDANSVRKIAYPGTPGLEHVIGGLEKKEETGEVCYEPLNHQKMVNQRGAKVQLMNESYGPISFENTSNNRKLLILSWGSTYGSVKAAMETLNQEGNPLNYISLQHLFPFPKELGEIIQSYEQVFIPELNMGQLSKLIQQEYHKECISFNKVQGVPFSAAEIVTEIKKYL